MNIVILVPVHNASRTLNEFLKCLSNLNPSPSEGIVFLENNSDDDSLLKIWAYTGKKRVFRLWFKPLRQGDNPYSHIAVARQILLETARKLCVDYAIWIDTDIMFPPDLITKLTRHMLPVVSIPYLRYQTFIEGSLKGKRLRLIDAKFPDPTNPNQHRVTHKAPNELTRIVCCGFGCISLNQTVLNNINLTFQPETSTASEDYSYCKLLNDYGVPIMLDGSIQLVHKQLRNQQWI